MISFCLANSWISSFGKYVSTFTFARAWERTTSSSTNQTNGWCSTTWN